MSIHYLTDRLLADCYCGQNSVPIPVQWVSEGRTASCGPQCGPGCPVRSSDSFDDSSESATTGKKKSMAKFDPAKYDAKTDSSLGYSHGGVRLEHMKDLILQVSDGDCPCGCAETPDRGKAQFRMGHDARLKGRLVRAAAGGVQVVITNANRDVREVLSPLEYAIRFNSSKLDWVEYVRAGADKARGTDHVVELPVESAPAPIDPAQSAFSA